MTQNDNYRVFNCGNKKMSQYAISGEYKAYGDVHSSPKLRSQT